MIRLCMLPIGFYLLAIFAQPAAAQRGWDYLGEANVDGNSDHDRIEVGRRGRTFRALRLQVENAPIEFNRVVVNYDDGRSETLRVRQRISPGQQSRAIDLRGNRRAIRSVEFWYERGRLGSSKPKLRLYGRA